jgi:hypothetical protein
MHCGRVLGIAVSLGALLGEASLARAAPDRDGHAERKSFYIVRNIVRKKNHYGLPRATMARIATQAAAKAEKAPSQLGAIYRKATDELVGELAKADRWASLKTAAEQTWLDEPARNNVTSHRLPGGVLAVKIRGFLGPVSQQLQDHLTAARNKGAVRGLILDLRDNFGGQSSEATGVLDQFFPNGKYLFTTEYGRLGKPWGQGLFLAHAPAGGSDPSLPIAVLVNGATESASELTVGTLKDHGRATVFGDRTTGKGVGQATTPLPDGRFLWETERRRVLPRLGVYHGVGIEPDVSTAQAATQVRAAAAAGQLRDRGDKVLRAALVSLWNEERSARDGKR